MFQLIFQKVISSENTQKFILPSYCTHYFQLGVKVLHLYILYIPFLLKVLSKFYISSTRQQTFHILRSFTYLLSVKFHFPIAMVCVCVCVFLRVCVCVCVCVCLYSSTVEPSPVCSDTLDILEGLDQQYCVVGTGCFYRISSSQFLNLAFFTSKDKTPGNPQTGEMV